MEYVQPVSYKIGDRLFYNYTLFGKNYVEVEIVDIYIDKLYGLEYETIIEVKETDSDMVYRVTLANDGYRLVQKFN